MGDFLRGWWLQLSVQIGCQAPEAKFRDFHCEQSARPSRALSRCTGILLDLAEVVGWEYGCYASRKREISLATQKTEIEFRSSSIQNEPRYTCNFEISETKTLRSKVEIKNTSKKVYTWIVWARISDFLLVSVLGLADMQRYRFLERVWRIGSGGEGFRSKFVILKHTIHVSRCILTKSIKNLSAKAVNSDISDLQVLRCSELDFFQPASNLYCKISRFPRCLTA